MYDKYSVLRIEMTINDPREFKVYKKVGHKDGSTSICRKKEVKGRSYTGFNVWEKNTFELITELSNGSYLIRGFTNRDIRRALYQKQESDLKATRNRVTRLFTKLRAHGLIKKVPHSLRYHLTEKGRRVFGALIETKNRTYPELASWAIKNT